MIDIDELDIDKLDIEKFGYTKETFKGSELELFIKSVIKGLNQTIEEEVPRLMKEYNLSYAEALSIVIYTFKEYIKEKRDYK